MPSFFAHENLRNNAVVFVVFSWMDLSTMLFSARTCIFNLDVEEHFEEPLFSCQDFQKSYFFIFINRAFTKVSWVVYTQCTLSD